MARGWVVRGSRIIIVHCRDIVDVTQVENDSDDGTKEYLQDWAQE